MPTISVIVPVRDDATMLRRVLADLAAQTRPADEVIVVDNASHDDSAEVARTAGARVVSEPRHGIWPAAARGYDAARADIIARLDADSRPPADWLMRIEREFAEDDRLDVVTGPGDFYGAGTLVRALGDRLYIGGYFWAIGLWCGRTPVFGSNFAMRSEVWRRTRQWVHRDQRRVHDDLDLSLHLPADVAVLRDDALRVGISARPFATWRGLGRRLGWAYRTLALDWPGDKPWRMHAEQRRDGPTGDHRAARRDAA